MAMSFEFSQEYRDYIRSPRWKQVCSRYWGVYGRKCQACGRRTGNLHVHHMDYARFGRESLGDLKGLCDPCHKAVHQQHRKDKSLSLRLVTERYVQLKRKA